MKGLWNAILKVEGRMRGIRLSRFCRRIWLKRWRILFIGEIWHIVVGVKVSVGCINFEKCFIWGTRRERIMILKLRPLGSTNLGLNLDNGIHECGTHTS